MGSSCEEGVEEESARACYELDVSAIGLVVVRCLTRCRNGPVHAEVKEKVARKRAVVQKEKVVERKPQEASIKSNQINAFRNRILTLYSSKKAISRPRMPNPHPAQQRMIASQQSQPGLPESIFSDRDKARHTIPSIQQTLIYSSCCSHKYTAL